MLPDDENCKLAVCANNVFRIWDETKEQKSTQLVFCDLSTPSSKGTIGMKEKEDGSFEIFQEVPKEKRNGRCDITVSTSFFVPKAFTPLQWAPMYTPSEYLSFASTVYDGIQSVLNRRSIWYKYHEADGTVLEGFLARGDRRCSKVILEAYRLGAMYDAWIETWDYSRWLKACENTGVDMSFFALRERSLDEILPWMLWMIFILGWLLMQ